MIVIVYIYNLDFIIVMWTSSLVQMFAQYRSLVAAAVAVHIQSACCNKFTQIFG